jgi:hypothetical protein
MTLKKRLVQHNDKPTWELDLGTDLTGKKKRRYFRSQKEIDGEISKLRRQEKSYGDYWVRLTPIARQSIVATLMEMDAEKERVRRAAAKVSGSQPKPQANGNAKPAH